MTMMSRETYGRNDRPAIIFTLFGGGSVVHRLTDPWPHRPCYGEWRATDQPRTFVCSDCGGSVGVSSKSGLQAVPHRNYRTTDQAKEPLATPPRLSPDDEAARQAALTAQREADEADAQQAITAQFEQVVAAVDAWKSTNGQLAAERVAS